MREAGVEGLLEGLTERLAPSDLQSLMLEVYSIRNTEVVSDATNVLALECALRRHADQTSPVLLVASQRMTRAQGLPGPRSWAHFRLLCMCAGGRDRGSFAFEVENLLNQLRFYLRYLEELVVAGWSLAQPRIALTDFSEGRLGSTIEQRIVEPLRAEFRGAQLGIDPTRKGGKGYYQSMCFKLFVRDGAGVEMEVGDGGDVPWTQKLLNNAKERLIISAVALERLAAVYSAAQSGIESR